MTEKYNRLLKSTHDLYHQSKYRAKLLFHGWHHIKFVHDKTIEFAEELNANTETASSAALVHDLNYLYTDDLNPGAAKSHIFDHLTDSGFNNSEVETIIFIVTQAHTKDRNQETLTKEAMALSDADTLFKSLPITPILFTSKYISENRLDIKDLAEKIVSEQRPLMDNDKYFYTDSARKRYIKWARTNLTLWENVLEGLDEDIIKDMLKSANNLGVL